MIRMITTPNGSVARLGRLRRRRPTRVIDQNADYVGRRPSGDPRIDLAAIDRII